MADIAPMLSILNYDPYANPPEYGKPDSWVKDNTYRVSWGRAINRQRLLIVEFSLQVKANEALYEDKAKLWLKRDKPEDQPGGGGGADAGGDGGAKKVMDYDDDNQVPNDNEGRSGSQGKDKENDSR